jgi:hypothetical protein
MNPAVKYALGRIGLFILVAAPLLLLLPQVNLFIRLMAAVVISAILSFFVLKGVRDELTVKMEESVRRRREQKEKLRAQLAGDDTP